MQFADRLQHVEVSAIRELFKLLGKPGIISFAGGFPDSALFDVAGVQAATSAVLEQDAGAALQYGVTEGFDPLREQIAALMNAKMQHQGQFPRKADNTWQFTPQILTLFGQKWHMIGAKTIDCAIEHPLPQAIQFCFITQWGRNFRPHVQIRIIAGAGEIMRAGLNRHMGATGACLSRQNRSLTNGGVDKMQGASGFFSQKNHAANSLNLTKSGT